MTNLLRPGESGMSLDSVVFALKSCFKTKHQKGFFYSADSSLCRVCATVCDRDHSNKTCSVKGIAVFSPWPKRCTESHCLEEIFHTWSVGHAQGD